MIIADNSPKKYQDGIVVNELHFNILSNLNNFCNKYKVDICLFENLLNLNKNIKNIKFSHIVKAGNKDYARFYFKVYSEIKGECFNFIDYFGLDFLIEANSDLFAEMSNEIIKETEHELLIKNSNYIKKEDLIIGKKYLCDARNFKIGLWNGKEFEYERFKIFEYFADTEQHWDDGPPHGTVKPISMVVE